jgi:hypothetical protein
VEKWEVLKRKGWDIEAYDVYEHGKVVALGVPDEGLANLIAQLPQLKEIRHEWASIINRLANLALDKGEMSSNDRDWIDEQRYMALKWLGALVDDEGEPVVCSDCGALYDSVDGCPTCDDLA